MTLATLPTPRGQVIQFEARPDTTDWMTVNACSAADEYHLRDLPPLSGWAIDVGAHIGGVTMALLADNPELRVIAIEALPENVELLRINLVCNGSDFTARTIVLPAAASSAEGPVVIRYGDGAGGDFGWAHRFIGGAIWNPDGSPTVSCSAVSLTQIVRDVVGGPVDFMKIDCEGCEWSFLDDPAVASVALIRGEYHPRDGFGPARLRELLEPTHVVTLDDTQDFGPFEAVRR